MAEKVCMVPGMAEYPRNHWYVIAFSREVGRELLYRECLGDPVVLYRTADGDPVALFGRCPHRGMPLSMGKLIGDVVQCGYHGFEYDRSGTCIKVPSQDAVPATMCVHRYPLVEKWQWLWIWMGDPAQADPALIPDHREIGLEDPALTSEPYFILPIEANYLLALENLVDATHITYLHSGNFDTGNVAMVPARLEQRGTLVRMVREMKNELMSPLVRQMLSLKGERVNRSLILDNYSLSLFVVRMIFIEPDYPESGERVSNLIIAVTPGGPKSVFQTCAMAQTVPDQRPNRFEELRTVLCQDKVALEAIQRLFDRIGPERCPEYSVKSDANSIRTRRMITAMIEKERADSSVKPKIVRRRQVATAAAK
ncbi:MAG TPA: aromatic ring-hydroxylating dioxygenase subunit alpha [Candidatus Binataceae bacterium]|nr:aromatic ring-hydroxylating dioxygenase subunit alpha [Candidatus Binataceae bacterium]